MDYELQVYAISPVQPTEGELVAQAGESGLGLEVVERAPGDPSLPWRALSLRAADSEEEGFTIEVSPDLGRVQGQLRADRDAGEPVPDLALAATRLYVLTFEGESDGDEQQQAAFVVAAWALAALTGAVVFDPQEEFFADAESFWGLIMDDEHDDEMDEGAGDGDTDEDD